jgi:hypothetical protein
LFWYLSNCQCVFSVCLYVDCCCCNLGIPYICPLLHVFLTMFISVKR